MRNIGYIVLLVFPISLTACDDDNKGASTLDSGACYSAGCDSGQREVTTDPDSGVTHWPDSAVPRVDSTVALDTGVVDVGLPEGGPCAPKSSKQYDREVIYSGNDAICCITLDKTGVYWSEDGAGVYRLAPGSSTSELVYAGAGYKMDMKLDKNWLYISEIDQNAKTLRLLRLPTNDLSATPQEIFSGFDLPDMAVTASPTNVSSCFLANFEMDETDVFFDIYFDENIYKAPFEGGGADIFMDNVDPKELYIDGQYLYYSTRHGPNGQPGIYRVATSGGEPELVVSSFESFDMGDMIIDGDYFFWSDGEGLNKRSLSASGETTVLSRTYWIEFEIGYALLQNFTLINDRLYWGDESMIGWTSLEGDQCGYLVSTPTSVGLDDPKVTAWAIGEHELYIAFDDFFGDISYGVWQIEL